ncbi:MAG: ABC transporter permease subunit, partial [Acetobacteraceae bacterium]|nr:ABC transporter permease subunit [Acetobacteraceae bacterium]
LPIARNTASGLDAVPTDVIEAARGIGMTSPQVLLHVQTPLAFPVFLSGLRITVVQTIGLAVIAALVGAGGLGAIMFEGLFANALDLMLLGIIPVVLIAVTADTILRLLAPQAA